MFNPTETFGGVMVETEYEIIHVFLTLTMSAVIWLYNCVRERA